METHGADQSDIRARQHKDADRGANLLIFIGTDSSDDENRRNNTRQTCGLPAFNKK